MTKKCVYICNEPEKVLNFRHNLSLYPQDT